MIDEKFSGAVDAAYDYAVEFLKEKIPFASVSQKSFSIENINESAKFVLKKFQDVGFENARITSSLDENGKPGNPAIIASRSSNIPNSPTILLYAHHDVQPAEDAEFWDTDPFMPVIKNTADGERLFGRGSADDGAGIALHLAAIKIYDMLNEDLPVNVKIFIEGEEEIGSPTFEQFILDHKEDLRADAIVVADSGNWQVGVPAITATLRGVSTIDVSLSVLEHSVHSGMFSGPIIDANTLLCRLIATLHDDAGNVIVKGLLGAKGNEMAEPTVDYPEDLFRKDAGVLDGVELAGEGTISGRIWNKPSISVIGFDATPVKIASNVFAPNASMRLSLRTAPGQDISVAVDALVNHLNANIPFNAKVDVKVQELGPSYSADLDSKGISICKEALDEAFGVEAVFTGMGGSIPFTSVLKREYPNADVLMIGVEDPDSRAHSANESVHLGDLKKVILAETLLLKKLGTS